MSSFVATATNCSRDVGTWPYSSPLGFDHSTRKLSISRRCVFSYPTVFACTRGAPTPLRSLTIRFAGSPSVPLRSFVDPDTTDPDSCAQVNRPGSLRTRLFFDFEVPLFADALQTDAERDSGTERGRRFHPSGCRARNSKGQVKHPRLSGSSGRNIAMRLRPDQCTYRRRASLARPRSTALE